MRSNVTIDLEYRRDWLYAEDTVDAVIELCKLTNHQLI